MQVGMQTYGRCPNIQGAYTSVSIKHKESMLCQTNGVSICPHIFGYPQMFGCSSVCLDAHICWDAPKCMGEMQMYEGI